MTILRFHQSVNTPNGPGIIQGRMIEDGKTLLLVSHDPNDPRVAESVKEKFLRGIWVLKRYPPEQISTL